MPGSTLRSTLSALALTLFISPTLGTTSSSQADTEILLTFQPSQILSELQKVTNGIADSKGKLLNERFQAQNTAASLKTHALIFQLVDDAIKEAVASLDEAQKLAVIVKGLANKSLDAAQNDPRNDFPLLSDEYILSKPEEIKKDLDGLMQSLAELEGQLEQPPKSIDSITIQTRVSSLASRIGTSSGSVYAELEALLPETKKDEIKDIIMSSQKTTDNTGSKLMDISLQISYPAPEGVVRGRKILTALKATDQETLDNLDYSLSAATRLSGLVLREYSMQLRKTVVYKAETSMRHSTEIKGARTYLPSYITTDMLNSQYTPEVSADIDNFPAQFWFLASKNGGLAVRREGKWIYAKPGRSIFSQKDVKNGNLWFKPKLAISSLCSSTPNNLTAPVATFMFDILDQTSLVSHKVFPFSLNCGASGVYGPSRYEIHKGKPGTWSDPDKGAGGSTSSGDPVNLKSPGNDFMLFIIIGAAVGGVLMFVVGFLIVKETRRRKTTKSMENNLNEYRASHDSYPNIMAPDTMTPSQIINDYRMRTAFTSGTLAPHHFYTSDSIAVSNNLSKSGIFGASSISLLTGQTSGQISGQTSGQTLSLPTQKLMNNSNAKLNNTGHSPKLSPVFNKYSSPPALQSLAQAQKGYYPSTERSNSGTNQVSASQTRALHRPTAGLNQSSSNISLPSTSPARSTGAQPYVPDEYLNSNKQRQQQRGNPQRSYKS